MDKFVKNNKPPYKEEISDINLSDDEDTKSDFRILSKRKIFISKIRRRILKHLYLLRFSLVILGAMLICLAFLSLSLLAKKTELGYYPRLFYDFIFTPAKDIKSIDNRTNILILGKAGKGHEAPDLTDTIILVSVSYDKDQITLISLPRDIWIPELRAKINSTYYWGNQKVEGGGLLLAESAVEKIIGLPIQYGLVIDFSGFKKMIDVLGGIEVNVENSFMDNNYPIAGKENDTCGGKDPEFKCRYETVIFDKGLKFMDGETALKYVRSRHAEGDQGNDFARDARQQEVISAIMKKLMSKDVLFSPKKIGEFLSAIKESTETDIDPSSSAIIARRILEARGNVNSYVLLNDFLVNPPISPKYDNLYVLIPKENNWDKVQQWVKCILENRTCI